MQNSTSFKKGQSGNPSGISKKQQRNDEIIASVSGFVGNYYMVKMKDDFDAITDPLKRLNYMEKLLKFVVTGKCSNPAELEESTNLDSLSDNQIENLYNTVLNKINMA